MIDPTAASIAAHNEERKLLRAQVARLERALAEANTEIEALKANDDQTFVKGYDQAVHEIRDHFAKVDNGYIAAVIEEIWLRKKGRS